MIVKQQTKAIVVSLNSKSDLEFFGPCKSLCLDDPVISDYPFLKLTIELHPSQTEEVQDFLENFFESLQDELQLQKTKLVEKQRVVKAIQESTMADTSKEQLLDHIKGMPKMVDL